MSLLRIFRLSICLTLAIPMLAAHGSPIAPIDDKKKQSQLNPEPIKASNSVLEIEPAPESETELTQKLKLVGEYDFSVWFWDVYHIQLLTANGQYQPIQFPLMLVLEYKRSINSQDLIDETENQWQRFELDNKQTQAWLQQLGQFWPNVNEGDTIAFYIDQTANTHFYFNQKFIGKVSGESFANAFSQIWLAPNGPYPEMTAQITGKN